MCRLLCFLSELFYNIRIRICIFFYFMELIKKLILLIRLRWNLYKNIITVDIVALHRIRNCEELLYHMLTVVFKCNSFPVIFSCRALNFVPK